MFLRIISILVASIMLLLTGGGSAKEYDVRDPESCKLNFSVLSDSHIESNNLPRYEVFARSLKDVSKNKSGNDAVIFLGDNTMNGQTFENMLFHGAVCRYLGNEEIIPVMGNHDIGNGEGDYDTLQKRWYSFTNNCFGKNLEQPYYCEVINGYYFIVLGSEEQLVYDMAISETQFSWLELILEDAAKSNKPAFLFSHFPTDEVVDEGGEETDRLVNMIANYNKNHDIFCFVGHTHMPMYLFWSFDDYYGYPEIYLPRLTQLSGEDNEPYNDTGVGVEVEIYENEVQVRARDFYRSEWKYDTADDAMCEMTYQLKQPIQ